MSSFLPTIGVLTVAWAAISAFRLIGIFLLPSRLGRYAHISPDGQSPWALVTGASDGIIGRALAHELAARGFNVVLHGRNAAKLSLVMSRLRDDHPERSFRTLIAEAAMLPCMSCLPRKHDAAVGDLHLTVLINNAGAGPVDPIYAPLSESSAARITGNVSLNALFPLHLTRVLLPALSRSAPALVVNISSAADQGFPLLASYGASKQFVMSLTRAVRLEMAIQGKAGEVELLGVQVGRVTGVSGLRERPSLFTPDAPAMARAVLARVGHGHGVVVGYWAHALQMFMMGVLPSWVQDRFIVGVMRRERAGELGTDSKHA